MTSVYHTPVLLEESVRLLDIDPAGTYVDLTFGGGGHSRRILSALGDRGRLYAFDRIGIPGTTVRKTAASITSKATSASCGAPCGCAE